MLKPGLNHQPGFFYVLSNTALYILEINELLPVPYKKLKRSSTNCSLEFATRKTPYPQLCKPLPLVMFCN
jgi:hypothetical protein